MGCSVWPTSTSRSTERMRPVSSFISNGAGFPSPTSSFAMPSSTFSISIARARDDLVPSSVPLHSRGMSLAPRRRLRPASPRARRRGTVSDFRPPTILPSGTFAPRAAFGGRVAQCASSRRMTINSSGRDDRREALRPSPRAPGIQLRRGGRASRQPERSFPVRPPRRRPGGFRLGLER